MDTPEKRPQSKDDFSDAVTVGILKAIGIVILICFALWTLGQLSDLALIGTMSQ